ncbi:MAG: kelch repeat-containing protein [Polyangia bacterium]
MTRPIPLSFRPRTTRPAWQGAALAAGLGLLGALAAALPGCGGASEAACTEAGCLTLVLDGASGLAGPLDDVTVIVQAGATTWRPPLRERLIRLPSALSLQLPACVAAEPRLRVTVRARLAGARLVAAGERVRDGQPARMPLTLEPIETDGPGARLGAALAHDPVSGRLLLIGGRRGSTVLSEPWAWDGARWQKQAEPGLPARSGHAVALDPQRGLLLLFGGRGADGALLADTWLYDGAAWQRVAVAGPPARAHTALAPVAGGLLLSGGVGATDAALGDTWSWDGQGWREVTAARDACPDERPATASGPRCRTGASLVAAGPAALLLGGLLGPRPTSPPELDEVAWRWDGGSFAALPVSPATVLQRWLGAAAPVSDGRVLIGGGQSSGGPRQDFYLLEASSGRASPLLGVAPPARSEAALAYDPLRDEAILFGGEGREQQAAVELADTWSFHPAAGWERLR